MIRESLIAKVFYVQRTPDSLGYWLFCRIRHHKGFDYYQILFKLTHVEDASGIKVGGEVK